MSNKEIDISEEYDKRLRRAVAYRNRMLREKGVSIRIDVQKVSLEHYRITALAKETLIIDVFRSSVEEVFEIVWAFTKGVYATLRAQQGEG